MDAPTLDSSYYIQHYYSVLNHQPEQLPKLFYVDSSKLSRPGSYGKTTTLITGLKGINETIVSLDSKDFVPQTIDAQDSGNGLVILVTGYCSTSTKDVVRKRFAHTFFLDINQDRKYFISTDIFTYVLDPPPTEVAPDHSKIETTPAPVDAKNSKEVTSNGIARVVVVPRCNGALSRTAVKSNNEDDKLSLAKVENGSTKVSYASIVQVSPPVSVPSTPVKSVFIELQPKSNGASAVPKSLSTTATNKNKLLQKDERYTIHIQNLPSCARAYQIERYFSKSFGSIKQRGVQVRSFMNDKGETVCYGFVDFESATSMEAAIKASPISLNGRPVPVGRKRLHPLQGRRSNGDDKGRGSSLTRNGSIESNGVHVNGKISKAENNGDAAAAAAAAAAVEDHHHHHQVGDEVDEEGFQTVNYHRLRRA